MNIEMGDYVTLKSINEVKPLYKFWTEIDNGCVDTDTNYFTDDMLDAMESPNKYRVVGVNQDFDTVWVDIEGKMFGFEEKNIKDVYKLTKVS